MKAIAVIGANYGDEGKGLTVDYLARQQSDRGFSPLIVRFNGGAQAGHTVTHGNRRHVFSHCGAGSFVDRARTYLASPFIVNPYTLQKELAQLRDKGVTPTLYAHPTCKVTTIFDMALNSLAELSRGISRHGSCGMGINETVTRNDDTLSALKLGAVKVMPLPALSAHLKYICEAYVPKRLEQLGITESDLVQHDTFARMFKLRNYDEQAKELKDLIAPFIVLDKAGLGELQLSIQPGQEIILEGAQGLALDEQLGAFPYVTRSITGLLMATAVATFELEATEITPLYITRAYSTRHGAGPLAYEGEPITSSELCDETNVENMWQGAIRKAPLDLQRMKGLIDADLARTEKSSAVATRSVAVNRPQLMLTCLDQLGPEVNIVTVGGQLTTVASADLPQVLAREFGRDITVAFCSYGPSAATVKSWI